MNIAADPERGLRFFYGLRRLFGRLCPPFFADFSYFVAYDHCIFFTIVLCYRYSELEMAY